MCPECGKNFNLADVKTDCGYQMEPLLPKGNDPTVCDEDHGKPVKLVTRPDDEVEVIKERLQIYKDQTMPILEFYQNTTTVLDFEAKKGKKDYPILKDMLLKNLDSSLLRGSQ